MNLHYINYHPNEYDVFVLFHKIISTFSDCYYISVLFKVVLICASEIPLRKCCDDVQTQLQELIFLFSLKMTKLTNGNLETMDQVTSHTDNIYFFIINRHMIRWVMFRYFNKKKKSLGYFSIRHFWTWRSFLPSRIILVYCYSSVSTPIQCYFIMTLVWNSV